MDNFGKPPDELKKLCALPLTYLFKEMHSETNVKFISFYHILNKNKGERKSQIHPRPNKKQKTELFPSK